MPAAGKEVDRFAQALIQISATMGIYTIDAVVDIEKIVRWSYEEIDVVVPGYHPNLISGRVHHPNEDLGGGKTLVFRIVVGHAA